MVKIINYVSISILIVGMVMACSAPAEKITGDATNASMPAPAIKGLPGFALRDLQGNVINLQSLNGKKVFVNVWASWCPPCREEMPSIEKLYASADKDKVAFVMLSMDDDPEASRKFMQSNDFSLPVFFPAEQPTGVFNPSGIPATIIFDENGNIIKQNKGAENYNTQVYRQMLQ